MERLVVGYSGGVSELSIDHGHEGVTGDDPLVEAARMARSRSYVPYSHFRMGAAAEVDDGSVVTGAVVENVSLGLAMCAERAALFATVGSGAGRPRRLALVSDRTDGERTWPCGACLQVALELGGTDMEVLAIDLEGTVESAMLAELLPRGPHKNGGGDQ